MERDPHPPAVGILEGPGDVDNDYVAPAASVASDSVGESEDFLAPTRISCGPPPRHSLWIGSVFPAAATGGATGGTGPIWFGHILEKCVPSVPTPTPHGAIDGIGGVLAPSHLGPRKSFAEP